ncbi:hypothetical protein [Burkholderia multivorans]|uniref:hypothetical protein n=1 Tax=Burkholderia multivorans TaxID=87883 RepID=UPI000F4DA5D1|nr:hypothetical protein [Burkholderia multivorans]MBU9221201.1 hypothetical protein [Burkholderia multivorans]MBU9364717.1 hypothetical protein [Burkholderia multivorans]MBU9416016.1 hypothetical protein [Burkholderia multivorans]MBU9466911.1 hypothetical protein [Burkholderia multivorans]MBU9477101.1 hypothetical protein [Burkholderia multivorans]
MSMSSFAPWYVFAPLLFFEEWMNAFRPGKSAIAKGGGWIPSASVTPVLELLSKVGVERALT